MFRLRRTALLLICAILAGCASLLPRGRVDLPLRFDSFEAAQQALEQATPFRTTIDELKALGFDPDSGANVTLIPYPEVVARVAPHPGVPLAALDPGVRACITAQNACRAYEFHLGRQSRKREGNFWLDFLNFRRNNFVTGWRFVGLVVVRDDVVLFRNFSGEARIDREERQVNPLGPFQPAGEAAGRAIIR
ncbi:MAG: hypothetical protein OEM00_01540 [Burkholderiaceae bacterium]|nr:hypothetical protein [Burkholderiaceae bacterium]MDH3459664.1 hypothetical protein [Burkholderiaceae bacterium]